MWWQQYRCNMHTEQVVYVTHANMNALYAKCASCVQCPHVFSLPATLQRYGPPCSFKNVFAARNTTPAYIHLSKVNFIAYWVQIFPPGCAVVSQRLGTLGSFVKPLKIIYMAFQNKDFSLSCNSIYIPLVPLPDTRLELMHSHCTQKDMVAAVCQLRGSQ